MTKAAAIKQFLDSFGMPAYPTSSVPEDAELPFLTYELTVAAWEAAPVGMTVNLWFYTTSEKVPNDKAQEISEAIGHGGKVLACEGGYIWLKRGEPWCQSLRDESNANIKRRLLNLTAEYLTLN